MIARPWRTLCCSLCLLLAATSLTAQVRAALEVGGGSVPGFAETGTGWTGVSRLGWEHHWLSLQADAAYTDANSERWNAQGALSLSAITSRRRTPALTFQSGVRWNRNDHTSLGALGGADARLSIPLTRTLQSWFAAAAETPLRDKGRVHPLATLSTGADARLGPVALNLTLRRSWQSLQREAEAPGPDTLAPPSTVAQQLGYTDVAIGGVWRNRWLDVDAGVGYRSGRGGPFTSWRLGLSRRLTPQVALVGAAGREAPDLGLGVPGGNYLTLGVRLSRGERIPGVVPAAPPPMMMADRVTSGSVLLRLRVRAQDRVEIMGDFTDWAPIALDEAEPGVWQGTFSMDAGVYHVLMRVDGGEWVVPPSSPSVRNEFGGEVGVLPVP